LTERAFGPSLIGAGFASPTEEHDRGELVFGVVRRRTDGE
jgi:hypothetical protein